MQSFRRSVRQSFRRRTGTSVTLDDRKKIATSLNLEDGNKVKGHRKRAATEPASDLSPAHAGGLQVRDYNVHEYFTDYNYSVIFNGLCIQICPLHCHGNACFFTPRFNLTRLAS